MRIAIILACLLLTTSLAAGVTYKWEDGKGVHFADDFNSVPAELRTRAVPEDEDGIINFGKLAPAKNDAGVKQKDLKEIERVDEERDRIVMEAIKQHQADMIDQMNRESSGLQEQIIRLFARRTIFWVPPLLLLFYFWVLAVIDIVKSDFTVPAYKYRWLAVVLLSGPVGLIAYHLRGRSQKAGPETSGESGG